MKTRVILTSFSLIAILSLFTTCKKYPENTLWFKNPSDLPVMKGHITSYLVNGIDSLDLLNLYYAPFQPNGGYPYNKTNRDVKSEQFTPFSKDGYWIVSSDLFDPNSVFTLKWENGKKTVTLGGLFRQNYYLKDLFPWRAGEIEWEVVYLSTKKSKIKKTYNGNVYEITFEN